MCAAGAVTGTVRVTARCVDLAAIDGVEVVARVARGGADCVVRAAGTGVVVVAVGLGVADDAEVERDVDLFVDGAGRVVALLAVDAVEAVAVDATVDRAALAEADAG